MSGLPARRAVPVAVAALYVAAVLVPPPAAAWHATGHMITAQIAYDELTPDARREVDRLIAVLATFAPEHDHAVTASLWADELKSQGLEVFSSWHYINLPYNAGRLAEVVAPREENVVWALREATSTLRAEADDLPKARMLRFMLHLVGDVHQPLHCASRFTAGLAEGDRGGNDFPIRHTTQDLHAYWDSGAGAFPEFEGQDWQPMVRRLTSELIRAVRICHSQQRAGKK